MSSEPDERVWCRFTVTVNGIHFSVRPISSEDDQMRRALQFVLQLSVVAGVGAADRLLQGGKSANPPWLYDWARPRAVVVGPRPSPRGRTDALRALDKSETPLLSIWKQGAIAFRWETGRIFIQGFLDTALRVPRPSWIKGIQARLPRTITLAFLSPAPEGLTGMRLLIGLTAFALGVISCALLAIVEYGAWALVLPPRSSRKPQGTTDARSDTRAGDAPSDPGMSISVLAADGVKLAGYWYPASGLEPTGRTVLLLHGFAEPPGNLQVMRVAALNAHGWNTAVLDLRGYGRSEGPFATFGGRESGDVRAWLDALAGRLGPALALEPVLWGRSMGAAIVLRAAAENSAVKALVLESPMVDLDEAVAIWLRKRRLPFPRPLARLITQRAGRLVGVSLTRPRALDLAPKASCPVLIIHGSDDTLVTGPEVRKLAAAFPNEPRFIELPGAGHEDVIAVGGTPVIEEVMMFLDRSATP